MLMKSLLVLGLVLATPVTAKVYVFSGDRQNIGPGTLPGTGRCVPQYFSTSVFTPGNFVHGGTSNFGNYGMAASHCNLGPAPTSFVDGLAELSFDAGDKLFATYTGSQALSSTPGVFLDVWSEWIVTGGTGRFRYASGAISHVGTLNVGPYQGVPSGFYNGTFEGLLNISMVPEPASWLMMIAGFGLVGGVARRRASHAVQRQVS